MDSREYWKKREEENLRKNQKTEQQILKEIQSQYAYMADSIEKEINGFYTKYAQKEGITMAEAKKRVAQLDIAAYSRKAKKYVKDKDFSAKANDEMRLYNATMKINRLELLKANIGLEMVSGFEEMDKTFGEALANRAVEEYARQAGILGSTIQDMQKAARNIANASFKNATYSDRVWMYQAQMKSELDKLLQEGLIQGRNPRSMANHMRKLFGVSQADAKRLLVTEMARVQTDVQKDSFERNGYEQYVFNALGSACDKCKPLDNGKPLDVSKMMPGENAPPMHPNCRCSVSAYMDREAFEKLVEKQDDSSVEEEWNRLKNQSDNDIIKTDVMSGAKKTPGWKDRHAELEYESIRRRTTDCEKIASNVGFSVGDMETIKAHMFTEKHRFEDSSVRRFDADFEQAQAWDRLAQGKHRDTDVLLLRHEMEESRIMREEGLVYEDAHELANQKYNWWAEYLKEE